ncbi:MAG: hypothetical protein E4G91_04930 [Candidatus Zixiibacteriota bacterium]|nr:MAG: hypothetical protein E4G91_04930 [candidate division Zixibacteria bacterium]
MNHLSEDQVLEYVLEIIDNDSERELMAAHFRLCPDCGAKFENIKSDLDIIGGVKPYRRLMQMPNPKARQISLYAVIKVAALFIFGIFVGFATANWIDREPAVVTYAYLTLTPPSGSQAGCAVSDATEVSPVYYEEILKSQE